MSRPKNRKVPSETEEEFLREIKARTSGEKRIELTPKQGALKEALLTKLTREECLIAILHHFEKLTFAEIAKVLDVSKSVIEKRYQNLLRKLKVALH